MRPRPTVDAPSLRVKAPVHVVLDNLRSAFNVGSIFRTSDAAAVECLYLCGTTPFPPNVKLMKTALGSADHVRWQHAEDTLKVIRSLKKRSVFVVSLDVLPSSQSYIEIEYPSPVALVLGHELQGVSPEVLAASDAVIQVPMRGVKNSVNVATAYGIVLFEILRQYEKRGIV